MNWQDQYKHPNWQKRRLEKLKVAEWVCEECGTSEDELHVHHPRYYKGRMIWEYSDNELVVLCSDCHKDAHLVMDAIKDELASASYTELLAILGYIRVRVSKEDTIKCEEIFECDGVADALGVNVHSIVSRVINGKFPLSQFRAEIIRKKLTEKSNGTD